MIGGVDHVAAVDSRFNLLPPRPKNSPPIAPATANAIVKPTNKTTAGARGFRPDIPWSGRRVKRRTPLITRKPSPKPKPARRVWSQPSSNGQSETTPTSPLKKTPAAGRRSPGRRAPTAQIESPTMPPSVNPKPPRNAGRSAVIPPSEIWHVNPLRPKIAADVLTANSHRAVMLSGANHLLRLAYPGEADPSLRSR